MAPRNVIAGGTTTRSGAGHRSLRLLAALLATLALLSFGLPPLADAAGPSNAPVGTITDYPLAPLTEPHYVTAGPDGNVWFLGSAMIGRITLNGQVTTFPLPSQDTDPRGLTAGPDGNIWFTYGASQHVGKITPSGVVTEFSLSNYPYPQGIVAGADKNLYFTAAGDDSVDRITTSGVVTQAFRAGPATAVGASITRDAAGDPWFTTSNGCNCLVELARNRSVHSYPLPNGNSSCPSGLTAAPDGNIWIADYCSNRLIRSTLKGSMTSVTISTGGTFWGLLGIAATGDGTIWFSGAIANKIGSFVPHSGIVTAYLIPTPAAGPQGVAVGRDGNIWFAEPGANKIGRIITGAPAIGRAP